MSIRSKTLIIIAGLLISSLVGFALLAQAVLVQGFKRVESEDTSKNVQRVVDAVHNTLDQMHAKATDWSLWSETYKFAADGNQDFIDENINTGTVSGQKVNFVLIYDKRNQLTYGAGYDIETEEEIAIPDSFKQAIVPKSGFIGGESEDGVQGIVSLPEGKAILYIARPLLHEDGSGPVGGTFVYGRYIDDLYTQEISDVTHLRLVLASANSPSISADIADYHREASNDNPLVIKPLSSTTVAGYTKMPDLFGTAPLLVKIEQSRDIYQQGQQTLWLMVALIAGLGTILALTLGWLLTTLVTGPVSRLAREVRSIRGRAQTSLRVSTPRRLDDVGNLAVNINAMLASLDEAHKSLEHEKGIVEQKVADRTKELAEAQAELMASVRSLPFGFALISNNDEIVFSNSLFGQLVHHAIPETKEKTYQALQEVNRSFAGVIDLLKLVRSTRENKRPNEHNIEIGPKFFRFILTPVVMQDGKADRAVGTVLIVEDTTEEKALQRSRDEFFSIASHELRTPLTAIRGNSDMMLQYYGRDLKDPQLKEMVDDIHDASIRLISIVDDFLDTSRLELGKVEFHNTPFDVVKLSEQILREYDVTGSRKKLDLGIEKPPADSISVLGDQDRVRQILINLLSNAVRFTEKGGIKISFAFDHNNLKISVTDTGKGIPEEAQHLLFRKFQQASGDILTRDNTRSTGLGLYISKMLAEGMNGSLRLERTEVGKGSTFVLVLPLANDVDVLRARS